MSKQIDDLLAKELDKLCVFEDGQADRVAPLGAGFAARFLPTEQCMEEVSVSVEASAALSEIAEFLEGNGRIADDNEVESSPYPKVSGVIGSGFFDLNPAVVHVEVVGVNENGCKLAVSSAAKEGLIKQRTAEKAVKRLLDYIETIG